MTLREDLVAAFQDVTLEKYGMACHVNEEEAGELADAALSLFELRGGRLS